MKLPNFLMDRLRFYDREELEKLSFEIENILNGRRGWENEKRIK